VPRLAAPVYERLSGRRPWTEARRLSELQWRSADELAARSLAALRDVLAHASGVPHYRDCFADAGFDPAALRHLDDLRRVPVATRAALRAGFPDRVVAPGVPPSRRFLRRTSGSTGTPFEFYADRADLDRWIGSFLFFFQEWAGAPPWHTRLRIGGDSEWAIDLSGLPLLGGLARRWLLGERRLVLSGLTLDAEGLRTAVARLAGRPYFVWAYPSYAARLATALLARRLELAQYPEVVVASGEVLSEPNARVIGTAFRCRVVNHYSAWEVPHLAQSCPDNPDLLHVNTERAVVRIVRPDGGDAGPGEEGRVLISHLGNRVMPLINFDLGDWATVEGACGCGRGFPALSGLAGRLGEVIRTPAGRMVSSVMLCNLLTLGFPVHGAVAEFQALQAAADRVVLRVVPTPSYDAAFAARLRARLAAALGSDVVVSVEAVDHVEHEPSGKRLLIKSSLPPADAGPGSGGPPAPSASGRPERHG
jgi:phenylacetate-CoA ligase